MADQVEDTPDVGDAAVAVDPAGTEAPEWTPPTQQDWDNVQLALKKARQDARAARKVVKPEGEDAPDVDKAVAAASEAAGAKYKPMVVKAHARAAFAEAGLVMPKGKTDTALARVLRLLDMADIDVDDDGEVSGLSEQIDDIKSDFPELFAQKPARVARVDGADKGNASNGKPKSSAEVMASLINRS